MRTEIEELELRLGVTLPSHYRDFVTRKSPAELRSTLAAPDEILALNLEQRAEGTGGPADFGVVLYCADADCLLLRQSDESGMIYKWSHETRDIEPTGLDVGSLLESLSTQTSSEIDADDLTVVISRVAPWARSILNPINFDALEDAARDLRDVVVFKALKAMNPFTHEPITFDVSGVEIQAPDDMQLVLEHGRLIGECGARPVPEVLVRLARRLGATIFSNGR
jgi:hypothetical protein